MKRLDTWLSYILARDWLAGVCMFALVVVSFLAGSLGAFILHAFNL